MKQSLKIGLLLIVALLLYSVTNQIVEESGKVLSPTNYQPEKCYLSPDQPVQKALEHLYFLYSSRCCEMGHMDVVHLPSERDLLLLLCYFSEPYRHPSPPHFTPPHLSTYSDDPVAHYIYGLRKIVI